MRRGNKIAKAEIAKRVDEALALVRLGGLGGRLPRQLSGGQQQRVALARAIVSDPRVLVLDDATSAVDPSKEHEIREAMATVMQGRTTIVIAHRLHTIAHADRILVLENGAIVESGRHDELLRKGGRYAAFYRLQIKEQEPIPTIPVAS